MNRSVVNAARDGGAALPKTLKQPHAWEAVFFWVEHLGRNKSLSPDGAAARAMSASEEEPPFANVVAMEQKVGEGEVLEKRSGEPTQMHAAEPPNKATQEAAGTKQALQAKMSEGGGEAEAAQSSAVEKIRAVTEEACLLCPARAAAAASNIPTPVRITRCRCRAGEADGARDEREAGSPDRRVPRRAHW